MTKKHIVLLGDSIFDNFHYVGGGLSVIQHLQNLIPEGWQASLVAIDGNVASDVLHQVANIPSVATHLVISAGGNDALGAVELLRQPVQSMLEALDKLSVVVEVFRCDYRAMLDQVLKNGLPVTVCTIYDSVPGMTPAINKALALFNDVIIRESLDYNLPIIDLRSVCTDSVDYSTISPIEPSASGGKKIAEAIVASITHKTSGTFHIDFEPTFEVCGEGVFPDRLATSPVPSNRQIDF